MRRHLSPLLATLLAALPSLALAEPWTCQMTVRCAAQDCTGIDETYGVIAADHAGELFLTSPMGDSPATRLSRRGARPATYASTGPPQATGRLLTISEDGRAIVSVHPSDTPGRSVTIFGTCTAL